MAIEDDENPDQETSPTNRKVTGGGGLEGSEIQWPPWIKPIMNESFLHKCTLHKRLWRSLRNIYCLDCCAEGSSFCLRCRDVQHKDHSTLQIRNLNNDYAIWVKEIGTHLDISSIQTYVSKQEKAVFLKRRPHNKEKGCIIKGPTNTCQVCSRDLVDNVSRFCSIACKLTSKGVEKRVRHRPTEEEDSSNSSAVDNNVSNVAESVLPSNPQLPYKKRLRKGYTA